MDADEPHQAVAFVDRDQEVVPGIAHPVDQQRLDVRRQLRQHRVALFQVRPGFQVQQRLRRTHRPRIERRHAPGCRVIGEERHVHRDAQALPLRIRHIKAREVQAAGRYQPARARAGRGLVEQDGAGSARTEQLPAGEAQQVPVLMTDGLAA